MSTEKKQIQFNLMVTTIEKLKKHCDTIAMSMSAFVDVAIEDKLKTDSKEEE